MSAGAAAAERRPALIGFVPSGREATWRSAQLAIWAKRRQSVSQRMVDSGANARTHARARTGNGNTNGWQMKGKDVRRPRYRFSRDNCKRKHLFWGATVPSAQESDGNTACWANPTANNCSLLGCTRNTLFFHIVITSRCVCAPKADWKWQKYYTTTTVTDLF